MTLQTLETALKATQLPVAHYAFDAATRPTAPYIVYAEDYDNSALWADSKQREKVMTGTVDLFTPGDPGTLKTTVENALRSCELYWFINSTQYEGFSGLVHIEWVWSMPWQE